MENCPVEMICVCGTDGAIKPIRFRMEDTACRLQTIAIEQIVSSKPLQYAGVEMLQYLCKATFAGQEKLFEIRYTVRTHRWTLFRVVY